MAKAEAVREMFARIAPAYDRMNSIMTLWRHHAWRRMAVESLGLEQGQMALDVCSGTGDFVPPLRAAVGADGGVVGIDFCQEMLDLARSKYEGRAAFVQADACCLPFDDGRFDGVTVGWGLRNVEDLGAALCESARVLRGGGRFAALDMCQPKGRAMRAICRVVMNRGVPLLGALVGHKCAYQYLPSSTERFESPEQVLDLMEKSGFGEGRARRLCFGNVVLLTGCKR